MRLRIVSVLAGALLAAAIAAPAGTSSAVAQIQQTMDVSPSSGLSDGQPVTVSGVDWSANATLDVVQCTYVTGPDDCDWTTAASVTTDSQGSFATQYSVHETIDPANAPGTDCRLVTCLIGVSNPANFPFEVSFRAIMFAAGTLTPTPDSNLVDGQSIALNGAGWPAGSNVDVLQCRLDAGLSLAACDLATRQTYTVALDGTVDESFAVSQNLATGLGAYDCAAVPDGCGLGGVVWPNFGVGAPAMIDPPANNVINFGAADPSNPPQSKDDCKKGGWQGYTDDEGVSFANQGDCVSYVATDGKKKAKG